MKNVPKYITFALKDRTAIVTGGSGGIGSSVVKDFLREGANVVAADVNAGRLENYCRKLRGEFRGRILGVPADISNPASVRRLIDKTISRFKTIDILVNTAAVQKPIGNLIDVSVKDWIKCVNTNIVGTMLCCKAVLPVMKAKKHGSIINFSGGGATFPRVNFSAYGSTKAAIVRFTETISEEFKKYGIRVNAVSPGSVYTNMMKEIIKAGKRSGYSDYHMALNARSKGGDSPALSSDLCVFLASDASIGITGKLFSAVWDDFRSKPFRSLAMHSRNIYTLRRIDGNKFFERN
ncbi:MAG: SDR family oxidoreductase [Elusimicrobiota bacterium]